MKHLIVSSTDASDPIREIEVVSVHDKRFQTHDWEERGKIQKRLAREFAQYLYNNVTSSYMTAFLNRYEELKNEEKENEVD